MTIIENEVLEGKTITLDDKHFVNCTYTNCKLLYNGGDCQFTDCRLNNCQFQLGGAAHKTANFLAGMGLLQPPPMGSPSGLQRKPDGIQ